MTALLYQGRRYVKAGSTLPKLWYNGSMYQRAAWTLASIGREGANDQEGPGLYFSSKLSDARGYGENIAIVKLKFKHRLHSNGNVPEGAVRRMIKEAPDYLDTLTNWDEDPVRAMNEATWGILDYNGRPKQVWLSVWAEFYRDSPRQYAENMVKLFRVDGFVVPKKEHNGEKFYHAIVYNTNIIQTVRLTTRTELDKEAGTHE